MSLQANKKKHPLQHLIAGGCAGLVESSICHPLDTIKTTLQLRRQAQTNVVEETALLRLKHSLSEPMMQQQQQQQRGGAWRVARTMTTLSARPAMMAPLGPLGTAKHIVQQEGFLALYKGLGAVYCGIIPKMAIRFFSFEQYKELLGHYVMGMSSYTVFCAGLMSGLTEAVLVVTPAEVCKIRMQSQHKNPLDPLQRKYTNVFQTATTIVREEGIGALYKGIVPTMLRQGCNQAVNFTAYQHIKRKVMEYQGTAELQHWQCLVIGGFSGGMGPTVNNPLDVVKTRLQKQVILKGTVPKYTGLLQACSLIAKEEGVFALWKGITPRLMRIMPGQAFTFMTYESVSKVMHRNHLI